MRKILLSIIITLWLVFSLILTIIDIHNRNLTEKDRLPSLTQILKGTFYNEQEWDKNTCYINQADKFIVAGPYIPLSPGKYQVQYYLKGQAEIFIDVVSKKSTQFYASKELSVNSLEQFSQYELNFFVGEPEPFWAKDMEFRVLSKDGRNICLDKIVLVTKQRNYFTMLKPLVNFFIKLDSQKISWRL